MKKIAALCLYVMLVVGCFFNGNQHFSTPVKQDIPQNEFISMMDDMTVALVEPGHDADDDANTGEYKEIYCTGFWIGPRVIMTAFHCVRHGTMTFDEQLMQMIGEEMPPEGAFVGRRLSFVSTVSALDRSTGKIRDAETLWGTVLAGEYDTDLAIVAVKGGQPEHGHVTIADRSFRGQHLFVVGHPLGIPFSYSEIVLGTFLYTKTSRGKNPINIISCMGVLYFGNSGSAIFDSDGNVVGMLSFVFNEGATIHGIIHHGEIDRFMRRYQRVLP